MKTVLISLSMILCFSTLYSQVRINNQNQLFINHNTVAIGSSDFVITRDAGTFVGMYTNSNNTINGKPFYGYALGSAVKAFSYFDGTNNRYALNVGGFDRMMINSDSTYFSTPLVVNEKMTSRNNFQVGSDANPTFVVDAQNKYLLLNTTNPLNGFTDFTIRSSQTTFGGIYVDVNASSGKPFYGYATEGIDRAYSFYDGADLRWKLYVDDGIQSSGNVLEVGHKFANINGKVGINTASSFNLVTDFTINSASSGFGGMYVVSSDFSTGKPFYGYAIGNDEKAFSYFDAGDYRWKLNVENSAGVGINTLEVSYASLKVNGELELSERILGGIPPPGTIYYFSGAFWGVTSANTIKRLDNLSTNSKDDETAYSQYEGRINKLEAENTQLKNLIEILEKRMDLLEAKVGDK